MSEDILKDRIVEIYKSDEGINGKIEDLKTGFPDGEIIEKVEQLYEEGVLELQSDEDNFLFRADSDKEVIEFYPERLKYKN